MFSITRLHLSFGRVYFLCYLEPDVMFLDVALGLYPVLLVDVVFLDPKHPFGLHFHPLQHLHHVILLHFSFVGELNLSLGDHTS